MIMFGPRDLSYLKTIASCLYVLVDMKWNWGNQPLERLS